jgi:hypothetical protein
LATSEHQNNVVLNIVPHPRTLRKARMHVQQTVTIGLSATFIRRYMHQFFLWWVKTSGSWTYQELVIWFVEACWDICPVAHAAGVLKRYPNKLDMPMFLGANIAA